MLKKIIFIVFFPFFLNGQTAFISGNDTICDNGIPAEVKVSFTGTAPFSFSYNINGVMETVDSTTLNPYFISTKVSGIYTLVSFSDNNSFGTVSGSGLVTVLPSPSAVIHIDRDTLSVVYPVANFLDASEGNIVAWDWYFGDNTLNMNTESVIHTYKDSSGVYEASLIVYDSNGCSDTTTHIIWVTNEYWMYIPNSFTPDNDKINDKFCIEYNGIRENTFLFKIINEKGELMCQYSDPILLKCSSGGGWDGTQHETNEVLPFDTYVYEVYFQDFEGWKHKEYGSIIIIR